jgi:hypothetical protein
MSTAALCERSGSCRNKLQITDALRRIANSRQPRRVTERPDEKEKKISRYDEEKGGIVAKGHKGESGEQNTSQEDHEGHKGRRPFTIRRAQSLIMAGLSPSSAVDRVDGMMEPELWLNSA